MKSAWFALSRTVDRLSSGPLPVCLLFSVALFQFFLLPWQHQLFLSATGGGLLPDWRLTLTPVYIFDFLAALGPIARLDYLQFLLIVDVLFVFCAALLLCLFLHVLLRMLFPQNRLFASLAMLPFVAFFAELLENLCQTALILLYPSQPLWIGWGAVVGSVSKWSAFLLSLLLLTACALSVMLGFLLTPPKRPLQTPPPQRRKTPR